MLETCASLPEVKPVLTSDRGTYANTKGEPWFHDCILAYFDNYQQVDDLSSVHEDFYKNFSLRPGRRGKKQFPSYAPVPAGQRRSPGFRLYLAGCHEKRSGQGQGHCRRSKASYGDLKRKKPWYSATFYNDSQMLLQAKYSFVMENANEDMKPFGNFIAPSNDDDGVMRMIKKICARCPPVN